MNHKPGVYRDRPPGSKRASQEALRTYNREYQRARRAKRAAAASQPHRRRTPPPMDKSTSDQLSLWPLTTTS